MILLIVAITSLAGYDHFRHAAPSRPPEAARVQPDDITRYDGKTFRVTQTVDGDTVHIDVPDKDKPFTIIRLWGVDTPEVHGAERPAYFGPEASKFTHTHADHQPVRLELVPGRTRDRYGRLLAYIHLPDDSMLNERLIAEGYAYADTRFSHPRRAKFVGLEDQARAAGTGLWAGRDNRGHAFLATQERMAGRITRGRFPPGYRQMRLTLASCERFAWNTVKGSNVCIVCLAYGWSRVWFSCRWRSVR